MKAETMPQYLIQNFSKSGSFIVFSLQTYGIGTSLSAFMVDFIVSRTGDYLIGVVKTPTFQTHWYPFMTASTNGGYGPLAHCWLGC